MRETLRRLLESFRETLGDGRGSALVRDPASWRSQEFVPDPREEYLARACRASCLYVFLKPGSPWVSLADLAVSDQPQRNGQSLFSLAEVVRKAGVQPHRVWAVALRYPPQALTWVSPELPLEGRSPLHRQDWWFWRGLQELLGCRIQLVELDGDSFLPASDGRPV